MTDKAKKPRAKKAEKSESVAIENKMITPDVFDVNKTYKVEAEKGAKHLIEGRVYEVSGEIARELIKKGVAKLK